MNTPIRQEMNKILPLEPFEAIDAPQLLIEPVRASHGIDPKQFAPFLFFIDEAVRPFIPKDLLESLSDPNCHSLKDKMKAFKTQLPLIIWNELDHAPGTLSMSLICPAEFTNGVGRYLCDTLSRWLVPGKFLNIGSTQSLHFKFTAYPDRSFFFQRILIDVEDERELMLIRTNRDHLAHEIRLNITAVKHARHVISTKNLSTDQKRTIIQENIASVIQRTSKNIQHNVFDHMHHFLMQLSAEEKIMQIKDQFVPFMEQRPKFFDRDIFNEIKHFVLLFRDQFTAQHDLRHVGRLISFQYLFRKTLQKEMKKAPRERHLSLKLLKAQIHTPTGKKTVLGILGGINLLRENELFEERHILEAVQDCIPRAIKIEDSLLIDRRSHDLIRIFYLEVEKKDGSNFSLAELKELRKRLPQEIQEKIESIIHPVFMPRNEEEIMRNIVILSQELKYIQDIPQVIISFDQQTEEELSFTVILLRILKKGIQTLPALFQRARTDLKIESQEVKRVGLLRKRHIKEANVLTIKLDKRPFLRQDYTLDLFKARHALSSELNRVLNGIRDFNGGILSKQQEVFQALRDSLNETSTNQDFLLENFFYSLTPPLRQSLLPAPVLKKLFTLLLEALKADYQNPPYFLKAIWDESYLLLMATSKDADLKEKLIESVAQLQISSSDLSFTYVDTHEIHCIGYIYHERDQEKRTLFYDAIEDVLEGLNN